MQHDNESFKNTFQLSNLACSTAVVKWKSFSRVGGLWQLSYSEQLVENPSKTL